MASHWNLEAWRPQALLKLGKISAAYTAFYLELLKQSKSICIIFKIFLKLYNFYLIIKLSFNSEYFIALMYIFSYSSS